MECSGHQISFQFQLGLIRDRVTMYSHELDLKSLKSKASDFICDKCPTHEITRLPERILLFRHDYHSSNILQMINAVTDIQEDTVVEVVINAQHLGEDDVEIRPHQLSIHSYKTPTFCHFCGEMLFGMFKQGLKCEGCGLNFHKRCVFKIPNDCSYKKRRRSSFVGVSGLLQASNQSLHASSSVGTTSLQSDSNFLLPPNRDGSLSPLPTKRERSPSVISAGRPVWVDVQMAHRLKIPHTFVIHTYTKPTKCHFCNKMLVGVFKQGVQCKDCRYNAHKKCSEKVPRDCTGEMPDELLLDKTGDSTENDPLGNGDDGDSDDDVRGSPDSGDDSPASACGGGVGGGAAALGIGAAAAAGAAAAVAGGASEPPLTPGAMSASGGSVFDSPETPRPMAQPNIPVQRLVQSVKQSKRIGSKILKEGWLVHYTNKGSMRKRHYWRLDTKSVTLFQSDTGTNYYKEIPLSEILAVEGTPKKTPNSLNVTANMGGLGPSPATTPTTPTAPFPLSEGSTHCFEIRTANVDYYVGETTASERMDSGIGVEIARQWELAIRQALMPVQATGAGGSPSGASKQAGPSAGGAAGNGARGGSSHQADKPESASSSSAVDDSKKDISQLYQIFPDEVLGSGQFGIVYGGVFRTSGHAVAIKVIDKMRFPTKQEAALKNEVSILQNLHHPGVVNLERMFETPERIFVVMEKLKGDMLEMILSSEMGRLSERITRFIVTQILVALKHLHSKNIVHCDLKPENVLLSSDSDFPQVKLCDFGFARIIGEKGFRKSVVGTPAYLAPEVLRNKGYNRSLDMWSTGVIIYVSLSGTFPFNEDEDISEQIQNAAFMYPPNPWKEISSQAIDLIGNLLQVKTRKRYSVDKSLMHPWLDNYEMWCDLRDLERKLGVRWLTHESDDRRWEQHQLKLGNSVTEKLAKMQT